GVLNSLPVGIIIYKSNLEVLFLNENLKKFLKEQNFEGVQSLTEVFGIESFFQNLGVKDKHYQVLSIERGDKEVSVGITYMKLERFGEPLLLLIIENLEEKELLKRLSLWREVAVKLAHEIKNPLTPIRLSIERLMKRIHHELTPESKKLLEQTVSIIVKYVEELRKLALDFYYISQRPYFEKTQVHLIENFIEVIELYKMAYPEINFIVEKAEDREILIQGDPFQLKRVWINLIENSIKAMKEKGDIEIVFWEEGQRIYINYQDRGEGMNDELIDAFNTGDFSKLQRVGTGLLIIKGVIELHKGKIWAERSLQGGTKFTIELPKS
ncbi:MAG: sensor histidine kinase, partial [Caldimicrobium sp.]